YLSDDSSLTQLTIPVFNPSGGDWTEVTALEMGDVFSFSTEGSSVPLYLWVYEDGDGGAGVLSNNNKTETDYILVDLTMPTVSLGGAVYTNSAHTFTVEADDENGIASYLWTGPADCSFATPEAVSTEVSSDVEGLHELTVTVTDTAGNSAQASVDMIWDTTAPAALSSAPDLAASYDTGYSNTDNITAKWEELLFTGSSEAEAEIELYGDGELFGTTVADGSGSWSVTAEDFSGGEKEYVITAYSVDRAGNRSDPSPELILKVDTVAPSGSFSLPSTTSDNSVSASLTYTDDSGLWYYRFRNDGSSSWTYDYTPGSSENLTLRNNAGLRRVYLYVYDRAGNGRYTYDTINFYMPVEVQLYGFHSDYDYDGGGTEQWYWTLYVNGRSAFVRPEAGAVSYNMPGILNSASAYFKYASSALPYTYTVNVDVSSSSTDNLSLGGTIWEVDSLINSYGTFSTTTVDTNLRSLGTSVWAESVIQTTAYTITKYYLNYLEVGYYYRAVTAYAALDS
ncbi:MAG: Ig-like domain-containing protein, partial [Spirochaetales bacterium]|nr:Ig-like domain-containing protein [Spirochaetales bacterium]